MTHQNTLLATEPHDPDTQRSALAGLLALGRGGLPLLIIAAALDGAFAFFVITVQAFLPDVLGSRAGAPGLALGLYGGTRVLLQLPGGLLARRIGGRRLIQFGMAGGALALVAIALSHSTAEVYALTVLYGAATALAWPAVFLLAGDQTERERGALLSLITFCGLAGMAGGLVLGVLLVDLAPVRLLIPGAALALLAGSVAARFVRFTTPPSNAPAPAASGAFGRWSNHAGLRLIVPALALQGIGLSMLLPLLRQFAHDELALELRDLVLLALPAAIIGAATFLPAGRLADRIGRGPVVALGSALAALGVLLLASAQSSLGFAIGAIPLVAGYSASAPALGAWITDLTDGSGANVGLALTVQGVAFAIGPLLTALLIDTHGAPLPMRLAAALWLAAALCAAAPLLRARTRYTPAGAGSVARTERDAVGIE